MNAGRIHLRMSCLVAMLAGACAPPQVAGPVRDSGGMEAATDAVVADGGREASVDATPPDAMAEDTAAPDGGDGASTSDGAPIDAAMPDAAVDVPTIDAEPESSVADTSAIIDTGVSLDGRNDTNVDAPDTGAACSTAPPSTTFISTTRSMDATPTAMWGRPTTGRYRLVEAFQYGGTGFDAASVAVNADVEVDGDTITIREYRRTNAGIAVVDQTRSYVATYPPASSTPTMFVATCVSSSFAAPPTDVNLMSMGYGLTVVSATEYTFFLPSFGGVLVARYRSS